MGTARVLRQIVDAGTGGWMHIGALPGLVSLRVLRRSGMLSPSRDNRDSRCRMTRR